MHEFLQFAEAELRSRFGLAEVTFHTDLNTEIYWNRDGVGGGIASVQPAEVNDGVMRTLIKNAEGVARAKINVWHLLDLFESDGDLVEAARGLVGGAPNVIVWPSDSERCGWLDYSGPDLRLGDSAVASFEGLPVANMLIAVPHSVVGVVDADD